MSRPVSGRIRDADPDVGLRYGTCDSIELRNSQGTGVAGNYEETGRLSVETTFLDFVQGEMLPCVGLEPAAFWPGVKRIVAELTPVNRELLAKRDELQRQIDEYHRCRCWSGSPRARASRMAGPYASKSWRTYNLFAGQDFLPFNRCAAR